MGEHGVDFILANAFSSAAATLKGWNNVPSTGLLVSSLPDKQIQRLEKTCYFINKSLQAYRKE